LPGSKPLLHSAEDEHVLPGHEDLIRDENCVVLVKSARQRVVEWAAEHGGALLVRDAADEFDAPGIARHQEHGREVLVLADGLVKLRIRRLFRRKLKLILLFFARGL
jgi:hypothetical protein